MNKRTLLTLLAVSAPATVLAQMGKGRGGRGDKGARGDKGEKGGANALEVTLHEFEEDLKLTAAQQPAWESYAGSIRAYQKDLARERTLRKSAGDGTLVQRLDRAADPARDRLTAVEDIVEAAKVLLKTLTPEQQQVADPRLVNLIGMTFANPPSDAKGTMPK